MLRPRLNQNLFLSLFFILVSLTAFGCAGATLFGYRQTVSNTKLDVGQIADQATQAFEANMAIYSQILYGGRGLLNSSQKLTRKEFNNFVLSLDLARKAPGVAGMFFLESVNNVQKDDFISREKTSNDLPLVDVSNFEIWPTAQKSSYLVVTYAEPSNMSDIRKSLGFDFSSEPTRLAAFEQATQDNQATMTKPVVAAVNKAQIFVMVLPIYNQTQPITTPQERVAAIRGAMALSFRSERLFNSAFELFTSEDQDLQIMVYDGEVITAENLLYDSNISKDVLGANTFTGDQSEVRVVQAGNRTWTLVFSHPNPGFGESTFGIVLLLSNVLVGPVALILSWRFFDLYRHT